MPIISKAQLIKLQKSLKTDQNIGEKFGITRQAVYQIRNVYGIPSNTAKNKERNEKIVKAYKSGISGTAIAKKFGLSISQTYRMINAGKKGKKKVAKRKTKPKAIGTWPTPEKPKRKAPKKKVAKKKMVKKGKKKVVKKKK